MISFSYLRHRGAVSTLTCISLILMKIQSCYDSRSIVGTMHICALAARGAVSRPLEAVTDRSSTATSGCLSGVQVFRSD
jgi:hypothetical protein